MPRQRPPVRMLPQNQKNFVTYKSWKYKHPFPDEYKKPAKALMLFKNENIPLETTLLQKKIHVNKNQYKLAILTQQHDAELQYLINKFQILQNNPFLTSYEAKVLITELLWGKQHLKSSSSKVEAIKYYEEDLRESYIEARDICNPINSGNMPTYIRINTLAISIDDTLNAFCKEGWNMLPRSNSYSEYLSVLQNLSEKNFIRDYHISELLAFPPGTAFYNHPGYLKGKFIYQDKGSCLSSFLLNPKPNSVVLDACAASGMKTNHLANIMDGTGLVYANDIHPERVDRMSEFLNLTETKAKVSKEDFTNLAYSTYEDVKYILIDPSCTYSGIFFSVAQRIKKAALLRKQFKSSQLLRTALQNFPNVKRVVYTTCSLYIEECEKVIAEALKDVGDSFTLLNVKEMLWNEWANVSGPGNICEGKCLRIVPEYDLCQGYFVAVFERNFDVPVPPYIRKLKMKNSVYEMDELERVEKVNMHGRIVEKFIPKNKLQPADSKNPQPADLKKPHPGYLKKIKKLSKLKKRAALDSKQQMMKYINPNIKMESNFPTSSATAHQQMMKYINPNIKMESNFPTSSATANTSPVVFETTHNQLYP